MLTKRIQALLLIFMLLFAAVAPGAMSLENAQEADAQAPQSAEFSAFEVPVDERSPSDGDVQMQDDAIAVDLSPDIFPIFEDPQPPVQEQVPDVAAPQVPAPVPDANWVDVPTFDSFISAPDQSDTVPVPQPDGGDIGFLTDADLMLAREGEAIFTVTFVYMNESGTEVRETYPAAAGGSVAAPTIPQRYTVPGGKTYIFVEWDRSFTSVMENLVVVAVYKELTHYEPTVDNFYLFNYTGKPGKTVVLELPIRVMDNFDPNLATLFSNTMNDGAQLTRYEENVTVDRLDQKLFREWGITSARFSIDMENRAEMPFTSASLSTANTQRALPYVIQPFSEEPNYYSQFGFVQGDSINRGFARFELMVKSSAQNGIYDIPLVLDWRDAEGDHQTTISASIEVTGQKTSNSSSGGGAIGGSTPVEKVLPRARLFIESAHTEPENPKAGDDFEIVMSLVNTSKSMYLHNLQLSYSTSDDTIMPAGENTNIIFIRKLDEHSRLEVRIPVESQPDIPSKLVKLDVSIDYEDQKMAHESMSQTLMIPVLPIQRMKVDEPTLSMGGTITVNQEFEVELTVANEGKTVLHNLSASIAEQDNLELGTAYYGGNVDAGVSKKITLAATPTEPGEYKCAIEITYENDGGDVLDPPETKTFTITAIEEEEYDFDIGNDDLYMPPPPAEPLATRIMRDLPWQIYAIAGILLLVIIISMSVSARKRRKRAMEDDEMD